MTGKGFAELLARTTHWNISEAHDDHVRRELRRQGYLPNGRGASSPDLTTRQAAELLIAELMTNDPRDAVSSVNSYFGLQASGVRYREHATFGGALTEILSGEFHAIKEVVIRRHCRYARICVDDRQFHYGKEEDGQVGSFNHFTSAIFATLHLGLVSSGYVQGVVRTNRKE